MTLRDAMAASGGRIAVITFDDGYADNFTNALPILEKYHAPATIFIVTGDIGQNDVVWKEAGEDLPADILSWEMTRELEQRGWEIGTHAHEHIHFDWHNGAKQFEAIRESIDEIGKNVGVIPISFAYPYGGYTSETKSILRQQGIRYAVTTNPIGWSEDAISTDLLELRRVMIGGRKFHHFVKAFCKTLRAASPFSFGLAPRPQVSLHAPVEKIN